MPLTPGPLKAGPRGGIISQPFHALCVAPESRGREEGLADHLSASAQELRHCVEQVLPRHYPLNNVQRTHLRDVWDPWHSAAALLVVLEQPSKNLGCQVGSFSRWTAAPLSLSLVWRYADISRNTSHTKYLINSSHPPLLDFSPCIFPSTFNTLVCLTLGVSLHFAR